MSYSLKLRNGDLSLESGSYEIFQGGQKMVQDLKCWILEQTGTDPMHPSFGSVIDGGMLPTGEVVESPIGKGDAQEAAGMIETEIRRIISLYKTQQLARIRGDNLKFGHSTITPDEVIANIDAINTTLYLDGIFVQVKLASYAGQTLNLNFVVGGG